MIKATTDSLSDEALIHLAKKNHPGVIEIIVNRHKKMVFNLAYRLLGNYHVAEEAAQDTFVKAFQSIDSFRSDSKFTTWLYRICYNTCITYKRKKNLDFSDLTVSNENSLIEQSQNVTMEQKDRSLFIGKALKKLEPDDAAIVNLFYVEEMPTNEIANIVGISEGNVRIKLHRARKKLKEELIFILNDEAVNL